MADIPETPTPERLLFEATERINLLLKENEELRQSIQHEMEVCDSLNSKNIELKAMLRKLYGKKGFPNAEDEDPFQLSMTKAYLLQKLDVMRQGLKLAISLIPFNRMTAIHLGNLKEIYRRSFD